MYRYFKVVIVIMLLSFLGTGLALASEQVYFYYTDPAGTPLVMSDMTGSVVWRADYLPFGEETIDLSIAQNNKMLVGKEKDSESGLYYFGARYMDAISGRFVSPDKIGPVNQINNKINETVLLDPQRLNIYTYAMNNPYRYFDTDGNWSEEIHNHIIDVAFSSGNYMLSNDLKGILKQASVYVDTFQDTTDSYMHAMSASIYDEKNASKYMQYFIETKIAEYKHLMASGYTESAFFALGEAMHALMDSTSPMHKGFQKWKTIDAAQHIYGERDEEFKSNIKYLQESVQLIRGLLDDARRK